MFMYRWTIPAFVFLNLAGVSRADDVAVLKAIQEVGGRITRDDKQPSQPVIGVDLSDPREGRTAIRVTDAAIKNLKELKHLRTLSLSGTVITDAGMKELKELPALQSLDLSRTKLSDKGINELMGLKSLRELNLRYVAITDISLDVLTKLEELQSLNLGDTK